MTAISMPERLALQQPPSRHTPRPLRPCIPRWTAVLDPPDQAVRWRIALRPLLPGWDLADPADTEALQRSQVLLTSCRSPRLLAAMPQLQLVQLLGAAVPDPLLHDRLPERVQLARACGAHHVRQAMEYVLAAVLHYHRGFDIYTDRQRVRPWQALPVRTADERRVGIMGLGQLGTAVAAQLAQLGFRVRGWSRSAHRLPGVDTFHGRGGLEAFLRATEILVCLLPLTDHTRGILGGPLFDALPPGARLVHIGAAELLVPDEALAALDDRRLAHMTVDRQGLCMPTAEPSHPLWQHPLVTATPHVAGGLRPEIGAALAARNLQRWSRRESLLHRVDRQRGY
jgi:glyoxylate/hydroxypyruvate reductase A